MYKCAVFDIKLAHNRYFFIPFVQMHLPKISFGELVGGSGPPCSPLRTALVLVCDHFRLELHCFDFCELAVHSKLATSCMYSTPNSTRNSQHLAMLKYCGFYAKKLLYKSHCVLKGLTQTH